MKAVNQSRQEILERRTRGRSSPAGIETAASRYAREIRRRVRDVLDVVRETILDNRALGLEKFGQLAANTTNQEVNPATGFEWSRRSELERGFGRYIDDQLDHVVPRGEVPIQRIESHWGANHIDQAATRGARDASEWVGEETQVEDLPDEVLSRRPWRGTMIALYTRNFEALQTFRGDVSETTMERFRFQLTDGFREGKNPRTVANEIYKDLGSSVTRLTKNRSETIARSEFIHAHAESSLTTWQANGFDRVVGAAEISTSGDARTCPICLGLEGQTLSIEEARGVIPIHPQCRCSWIPVTGVSRRRDDQIAASRERQRQAFEELTPAARQRAREKIQEFGGHVPQVA